MIEVLKENIDMTISNNRNLNKDEIYCLCKKEINKFEEEQEISFLEYEESINYITEKIDY
jgi:hypothetical protein